MILRIVGGGGILVDLLEIVGKRKARITVEVYITKII